MFSPMIFVGETSSRIVTPDQISAEVVNMAPTEDGGFRSIRMGTTLWPNKSPGALPRMFGIHHAVLRQGQREILLVHAGDQVWEIPFTSGVSFSAAKVILGPASASPLQVWGPYSDSNTRRPTSFVTVPNGIIIMAEGQRPYFYDGEIAAPLGFSSPPGAPVGLGPNNEGTFDPLEPNTNVNSGGFNRHRLEHSDGTQRPGGMEPTFGFGRVGTVLPADGLDVSGYGATNPDAASSGGYVLNGRWRCRVAYIDVWGNISELSAPSEDVALSLELATAANAAGSSYEFVPARNALRQIAWTGISKGPRHVIGRVLYRTRDLENSGEVGYWFLPNDASVTQNVFATLPDRVSEYYPDNIPDAWLVAPAPDYDSMPNAQIGALAFGRLWMAGIPGQEGVLRASAVGRWGTVERNIRIAADPSGAEITALHATAAGLLVFTSRSTFLITQNDSGDDFLRQTLDATIGCVAPQSIVTTRWGQTIWLGHGGFYGWSQDSGLEFLWDAHRLDNRRLNRARLERSVAVFDQETGQYQCFVPSSGSKWPNLRYKMGANRFWHFDEFDKTLQVTGVCVSQDHRQVQFACGRVGSNNEVLVLGRDWQKASTVQPARFKTGWINSAASQNKLSSRRIMLWLRETGRDTSDGTKITVSYRRNYRSEVVGTKTVTRYPDIAEGYRSVEPEPTFWGGTVGTSAVFRRRRPFYQTVDIDIGNAECFQIEVEATSDVELFGLSFESQPVEVRGASSRR